MSVFCRYKQDGNTPTGVGKTRQLFPATQQARKHPHGRGEDLPSRALCHCLDETPPRAWGRRIRIRKKERLDGNTPTGVGKTHHCSVDAI